MQIVWRRRVWFRGNWVRNRSTQTGRPDPAPASRATSLPGGQPPGTNRPARPQLRTLVPSGSYSGRSCRVAGYRSPATSTRKSLSPASRTGR